MIHQASDRDSPMTVQAEVTSLRLTSDPLHLCSSTRQPVQYIVPYKDGKEAGKYWRWVEEVKPPLPRGFRHNFHMAAILLKVRGVQIICVSGHPVVIYTSIGKAGYRVYTK